jgi:hypothetical protein
MNRLFFLLLFVCLSWFYACEEDTPVTQKMGVDPEITAVLIKEKWNNFSQNREKIEVRTSDPQGVADPISVSFTVTDNISLIVFEDSLHDDGAFFYPLDGDVVAGDGIFSNTFFVTQINPEKRQESFIFAFRVTDKSGHEGELLEKTIFFGANKPPEILQVSAPDTFPWYEQALVQATISDSNGISDITKIYVESRTINTSVTRFETNLYDDGDLTIHGDPVAGDGEFSAFLDSTFRVGKQGLYSLRFIAEDSFCEKNENVPEHTIFVGNSAGSFISIFVPDTMSKPVGSAINRKLITASVNDPQGLADVDSVYFFSLKPDSSQANNGQAFLMVDNGLPFNINNAFVEVGDAVAGDGIYSFSLIVTSTTEIGTYTFTFFMRDRAGNRTPPHVRNITIIN